MVKKVINFGCRLNQYEGEIIKNISNNLKEEIIVINTCTVTHEAEKDGEKAIKQIKKKYPNANIVVTGCAAQINPQKYSNMKEVSKVLGNQDKLKEENYTSPEKIIVSDIQSNPQSIHYMLDGMESKTRMFIEIQNGCNHRCTFCAIPYSRGVSRSTPPELIIKQIEKLMQNNCQEIVLTGVDIASYGEDLPIKTSLGEITKKILKFFPELKRLRISSIDIAKIDGTLTQIIQEEERFMPHLHISLQSGDNLILKRMKRRHNREQVLEYCKKLSNIRKDITYGADLIVGFPTETEKMFNNSIDLIKDIEVSNLHVFPFSPHYLTPAAKMPQVFPEIIKERSKIARQVGDEIRKKLYEKSIGKIYQILIEKCSHDEHSHTCSGYAPNFMYVKTTTLLAKGSIVNLLINNYDNKSLIATVT